MPAQPFHPRMGRPRRPVAGWVYAVSLLAGLVCSAWAGAHGLGVIVGWAIAVAAVLAIAVGLVVGSAWFAGWAVRAIRDEIGGQR